MEQYTYCVIVDKQIYARDMELQTALLLTQALFEKWHSESNLAITIERDDPTCKMCVADTVEVMK